MDFLLHADTTLEKLLVMLVAVGLFLGVTASILFLVEAPRRIPRWAPPVAFLGPAAALVVLGLVYPALLTVRQSFLDRTGDASVGFGNYATLVADGDLRRVLLNTALWVLLVPPLSTLVGLVYAVVVDGTRFEALAKALVFLPMAISMVGASIIWRYVYEFRAAGREQIGLANQILVSLGLEPYQFLVTDPWNTLFLVVVLVWIQAGYAMTVLSAAIKAIPDDIVEAARMDGVSGVQMFHHITVPAIRPALVVVLTTVAMITLKAFDIVRTMTGGNFQTSIVANEFYDQAFRQSDAGLGAALAVVLFALVVPLVVYNVRQMRLSEEVR